MTSFVEEATLGLNDQASSKIRLINREIKKLLATAQKLNGIKVSVRADGVADAKRKVKSLADEIRRIPTRKSTNLTVSGTEQAKQKIKSLAAEIARLRSGSVGVGINHPGSTAPAAAVTGAARSTGGGYPRGFDRALMRMVDRIGYAVEQGVIRGFQRGATARDVSNTRLELQNLEPDQRTLVDQAINSASKEFTAFSRGEIQGVISELIPVVRGENDALLPLTQEVLKLARLQVELGEGAESAIQSAFKFAKAGEQSGKFTDPDGNIDADKIGTFFDILKRSVIDFGIEIDANLIRTLTKSLRTSKFGLDVRGLLTAILLAEEAGSTAGVGINQAIKQLSGERVAKKQRAFAARVGLLELEEVQTGTEGGKPVIEFLPVGTKEEDLLRENPVAWVQKYVLPVMRKEGLDPSNPVQAAQIAGNLTSDRTATETLTTLILRAQEIEKTIDRALAKDVSDAKLAEVEGKSLVLSFTRAQSQLVSVMGEIANSMESILIPAFNSVASVANAISNFLAKNESPLAVAGVAAGGAAVVGGAVVAGKKVLSAFGPGSALLKSSVNLDIASAALLKAAGKISGNSGGKGKDGLFGAAAAAVARFTPVVGAGAVAFKSTPVEAADATADMLSTAEKERDAIDGLSAGIQSLLTEMQRRTASTKFDEVNDALVETRHDVISRSVDGEKITLEEITGRYDEIVKREKELMRAREGSLLGAPESGQPITEKTGDALLNVADEAGERLAAPLSRILNDSPLHGRRRSRSLRAGVGEQELM